MSETSFSQHTPIEPNKQVFQEELSRTNTVLGKGELQITGQTGPVQKKGRPSQVVASDMENVNGLWRWTDPSSKGCQLTPVRGIWLVTPP